MGVLANILVRQGRLVDAESELRQALALLKERTNFENLLKTGDRIIELAAIIAEQGRYQDAKVLLRLVLRIHDAGEISVASWGTAVARSYLAEILVAQRRWDEAAKIYQQIEASLADDPLGKQRFLDRSLSRILERSPLLGRRRCPRRHRAFRRRGRAAANRHQAREDECGASPACECNS